MKKLTEILFLLLNIAILPAYGQLSLGIEASPSMIFLRGNDFIKQHHLPTLGFSGSLWGQYHISQHFYIKTGFGFERKGSFTNEEVKDMNGQPLDNVTANINFNYLNIPLLFGATIGNKRRFYVNGGPFLGYLLKQTFVYRGETIPKTIQDNTHLDKKLDLGASLGLGFILPFKEKFAYSFEIRNNLGLRNVSKVPVFNNGTTKTNSTNLLMGFVYKINTSKKK